MRKDLASFNGNPEHDMWVDFDNYANDSSPDVFDKLDYDNFIDNRNDSDK